MPPTLDDMPGKGRPQAATRLDAATIAELDRLAQKASSPLRKVSRSDVLRYAVELGIAELQKQYGAPAGAAAAPKPKRKRARP
jgi:hypothetical protein